MLAPTPPAPSTIAWVLCGHQITDDFRVGRRNDSGFTLGKVGEARQQAAVLARHSENEDKALHQASVENEDRANRIKSCQALLRVTDTKTAELQRVVVRLRAISGNCTLLGGCCKDGPAGVSPWLSLALPARLPHHPSSAHPGMCVSSRLVVVAPQALDLADRLCEEQSKIMRIVETTKAKFRVIIKTLRSVSHPTLVCLAIHPCNVPPAACARYLPLHHHPALLLGERSSRRKQTTRSSRPRPTRKSTTRRPKSR